MGNVPPSQNTAKSTLSDLPNACANPSTFKAPGSDNQYLPWCEVADGSTKYCRGDCVFNNCKNALYTPLPSHNWCKNAQGKDFAPGCIGGKGHICVKKDQQFESNCDPKLPKCPIELDINLLNTSETFNQAALLSQKISKEPCKYFYCNEGIEDILKNVPLRIRVTVYSIITLVLTSLTLSITQKIIQLRMPRVARSAS